MTPSRVGFQGEPNKFLSRITCGRVTCDFEKNAEVFAQGDPARAIHFIQNGRVRVTVTCERGKQATVAILHEGQFFGEGCLNKQMLRTATATAITDCRIISIRNHAMNDALLEQPGFAKFFMKHLLSRNSRIEADVVDHLFNSSEKRLARMLLLLAQYSKEGSPPIVPVSVKQETLAEMIGTTRSRVSFFMTRFRAKGFIDYDFTSDITVHVSLLNSVLRDQPHIKS